MMINTSECENCKHSNIDFSNKAKPMVHCEYKEKSYIYGQCIDCDCKATKKK